MTPDTLQEELYQKFIDELAGNMCLNDVVYSFTRFLSHYIPFDKFICYRVDRAKGIMNVVVDYSPYNEVIKSYPQQIKKIISFGIIESITDNLVTIQNDVINVGRGRNYIMDNFKVLYKSSIVLYLDIDKINNSLFVVVLFSLHPDQYREEHSSVLLFFYDFLKHLFLRFFQDSAEPYLFLTEEGPVQNSPEALLRRCAGLSKVMRKLDAVADQEATVLIRGASGTGKELVAEALHALSHRQGAPFVKVNCGAIPETLLDSELFGYEKGAFTGANTVHAGYFEQAHRGSIYLDEIGELTPLAQVRLLRVLETKEIRRVGGSRHISVDIRVIAATHRDLWHMVQEGRFREDLWYRLNVYPLSVPPLAQRREDIPVLAEYFYKHYVEEKKLSHPPQLSRSFILSLTSREWPGNVRQLRYVVERALIESVGEKREMLEIAEEDQEFTPRQGRRESVKNNRELAAEMEKALVRSGGRIQGTDGAAVLLGVSPSTLRARMRTLGIPLPRQSRKER